MEKVSKEQRTYNEISKKKKNRYSRIFTSNFFKTIRNDRRFVLKEEILIDHPSLKSNDTGGQRAGSLCERERERDLTREKYGKNRDILTRPYLLTSRSIPPPRPTPPATCTQYPSIRSSLPKRIYDTDNKAFNEVAGGIWWQGSTRRVHCARPSCLECIN